ncbi:MAG: DUF1134 domain-containing protein [Rhodospirillaceae bacterium]
MLHRLTRFAAAVLLLAVVAMGPARAANDTYSPEEIMKVATDFFGGTTEGLASIVEKIFADQGRPNAYIAGEEVSGAFFVGLRYGKGTLNRKATGAREIFWRGPSVGWDFGGNASKVFTLVYNLDDEEKMFRRFPGVDGSFYFVAGFGMNYQKRGGITVAPIRTGVGLRAGANIGYLSYEKEAGVLPF